MKYELKYDEERDLILGQVRGGFDSSVVSQMVSDLGDMIRKRGCYRFLNDLRDAKITSETFDIYRMPRNVAKSKEAVRCRRAILVNPPLEDFLFLETASVNMGHQFKIFTDPDAALEWLQGREPMASEKEKME